MASTNDCVRRISLYVISISKKMVDIVQRGQSLPVHNAWNLAAWRVCQIDETSSQRQQSKVHIKPRIDWEPIVCCDLLVSITMPSEHDFRSWYLNIWAMVTLGGFELNTWQLTSFNQDSIARRCWRSAAPVKPWGVMKIVHSKFRFNRGTSTPLASRVHMDNGATVPVWNPRKAKKAIVKPSRINNTITSFLVRRAMNHNTWHCPAQLEGKPWQKIRALSWLCQPLSRINFREAIIRNLGGPYRRDVGQWTSSDSICQFVWFFDSRNHWGHQAITKLWKRGCRSRCATLLHKAGSFVCQGRANRVPCGTILFWKVLSSPLPQRPHGLSASRSSTRFQSQLEIIKFLCKDVWQAVFHKNIDNLRTNHKVSTIPRHFLNKFRVFMFSTIMLFGRFCLWARALNILTKSIM